MISPVRVYLDRNTGEYTLDPPEEGLLVCTAGGEVPREHWARLTAWLESQKLKKTARQTKAVKSQEDK